MRYGAAIAMVLWACDGGGSTPRLDGATSTMDARAIDAAVPVDAAIDAANPAITAACTSVCDALATCFMEPMDPTCYTGCAADLADCTPQQVQAVDACKTEACGDPQQDSPLVNCIAMVACVNM